LCGVVVDGTEVGRAQSALLWVNKRSQQASIESYHGALKGWMKIDNHQI